MRLSIIIVAILSMCLLVPGAELAEDPEVSSAIRMLEAWIASDMAYKGKPGLSIGVVYG